MNDSQVNNSIENKKLDDVLGVYLPDHSNCIDFDTMRRIRRDQIVIENYYLLGANALPVIKALKIKVISDQVK